MKRGATITCNDRKVPRQPWNNSEAAMEPETIDESGEPTTAICAHGRLIENVMVRPHQKRRVRCLECGTTFDDPHGQAKSDDH